MTHPTVLAAQTVACPRCGARPGETCRKVTPPGRGRTVHHSYAYHLQRMLAYRQAQPPVQSSTLAGQVSASGGGCEVGGDQPGGGTG